MQWDRRLVEDARAIGRRTRRALVEVDADAADLVVGPPGPWLAFALDVIERSGVRADRAGHLAAYARHLAFSGWSDGTTRAVRAQVAAALGVAERTVTRLRSWFIARGLVHVVTEGLSPAASRRRRDRGRADHGRAAVLVTTRPQVVERSFVPVEPTTLDNPFGSVVEVVIEVESFPVDEEMSPPCVPSPPRSDPQAPARDTPPTPRRRARHAAGAALRPLVTALAATSDAAVAAVLRRLGLLGWSAAGLKHALDHDPDGTERPGYGAVRYPAAWLAARLAPWAGREDPEVARLAAAALRGVQARERCRLRRAEHEEALAAACPPPAWFTDRPRRRPVPSRP